MTYHIDHTRNDATEAHALPGFVNDLSVLPASVDQVSRDTVYPHPFAGQFSLPFSEYLFSTTFAQGNGTYEIQGEEIICNHKTWKVRSTLENAGGYFNMWVDQTTGVILKYEAFGGSPNRKYTNMECIAFAANIEVATDKMVAPWK